MNKTHEIQACKAHLEELVGLYHWTCISQPPLEIAYRGFSEVRSVKVCKSGSIAQLCDAVAYLKYGIPYNGAKFQICTGLTRSCGSHIPEGIKKENIL